jgi:hypothetical protein
MYFWPGQELDLIDANNESASRERKETPGISYSGRLELVEAPTLEAT